MRRNILITLVLIVVANYTSFAQLKINQYGRVGIGIDPHPSDKFLIKGNLCLTTFPEIPAPLTTWGEIKIKVGNGWPGAEIGATPLCKIAFWASGYGYNSLYASHYYTQSDTSVKTNIQPITHPLEKIMGLNAYSYNLKSDSLLEDKTTFGFLAQEIHNIIPDITDTAKGIMLIDYQQIVPLLVGALKEQQNIIDSLKIENQQTRMSNTDDGARSKMDSLIEEINEIKNIIRSCCQIKLNQQATTNSNSTLTSSLQQNKPNPFSENTIIEFQISEKFSSASIILFDMQGTLKKIIPIFQKGKGQIEIKGFELNAGMYLYSLIVDDIEIDTKRMILMN